jgi:hypothetical protein
MKETVTCTACGTVLGIPKGGIPKDGLSCNWCGYVNVKAPEPEAKPVAAAAAPAREAARPAPKPKAPPHPLGDDEDDNGEAVYAFTVGGFVGVTVTGVFFYIGLQAFIFGSYESARVRRNRKGQTDVTITWRICFIPMAPKKVNWRQHEGVAFGAYDSTSLMDWLILIILFPMFIIPAILWWYYIIFPDRFFAALCRDRGFPETYLYRGTDEKRAKEVAQVATDATGLPMTTPL